MISEKKLIALLDRYEAHYHTSIMADKGISEDELNWKVGAFTAIHDLKHSIVEHHHDLEATE